MAAKLPSKYTGAVVLGSNISGTFATIISILSGFIWTSVRKAAIYYFITAMFVILICFDTFFAMPLNRFYRYHEMQSEKLQEKSNRSNITGNGRPPYWKIFKQSFAQLFNVFMIFFVTLSVFPTVYSDIKPSNEGELFGIISKKYFTPVTCFLTFNVFAMLGSLTTSWIQWVSCEPFTLQFFSSHFTLFNTYSLHQNISYGLSFFESFLFRFSFCATIIHSVSQEFFLFTLQMTTFIGRLLLL